MNWPLTRRLFSRAANAVARLLLRVPIHDYTTGYRAYSRRAAELIGTTCRKLGRGFIPLSVIAVNVHYHGLRVIEVPTTFVNRARGESSFSLAEVADAARGLMQIYALKRRLSRPMRKRPAGFARGPSCLSRRRPTFPRSHPRSIIGDAELNCRVRNGNGCFLRSMITGNS